MAGNLCGSREKAKKDYFPSKCGEHDKVCDNLILTEEGGLPYLTCGIHGCGILDLSGGRDIINCVKKIPEYFYRLSKMISVSGSV